MHTLLLWWSGIILEGLILLRSFQTRCIRRYPVFFAYIGCVLLSQILRYVVYSTRPPMYVHWYWRTQFVCLIVGYGIILEIMEKTLALYNGAKKFAQAAGLVLLALVLVLVFALSFAKPVWFGIETELDLERDLRIVEALIFTTFLGVIFRYGIGIGKNIKGMILGYGLYIATAIVGLAGTSYVGSAFNGVFSAIQAHSYLVSLLIWTVTLWSYRPNPVPERSLELETDYEAIASKTRNALGAMRTYLAKAARS